MAEAAYWTERAAIRDALDVPPLPVWVRARRTIIAEMLPAEQAPEPLAPPPPSAPAEPSAEAGAGPDQSEQGSPEGPRDAATEPAAV